MPSKKSIKIKKFEKPSPNQFAYPINGYHTNRADAHMHNRPVSASTSKRNLSNRPRKDGDFFSKPSLYAR